MLAVLADGAAFLNGKKMLMATVQIRWKGRTECHWQFLNHVHVSMFLVQRSEVKDKLRKPKSLLNKAR